MFGVHMLKLHQGKCRFPSGLFGPHDLLGGLGVQKAKVNVIAKVPKPTNLDRLKAFLGWLQIINNNLSKGLIKLLNL
jgi:hypothetical protein